MIQLLKAFYKKNFLKHDDVPTNFMMFSNNV